MQALAFGGIALFLPLIRDDVGITFGQAGTLAAATTLTYALLQIPAGMLADRFDAKKLFLIGLVGTNALSLSFASLHSYHLLLANQAASGCFRALLFAPGVVLMSRQFRPDRQATAMGLFVAGGMSSNILLNALGPWLVGPLGWRLLFVIFSASGLLLVLAFALWGDAAPRPKVSHSQGLSHSGRILRHPVMWLTGYIQFVRLAVVSATGFWLPTLIVDDKGFSLTIAGVVVAIGALATAPANFLGGLLSDRLGRPLMVIAVSLSALVVSLTLITAVNGLVPLLAVVILNSIFIQLYFGPLFAVPARFLGTANAGIISGYGNFCANLGGFGFSYGLGLVKDATGSFDVGLLMLAGLCAGGVLATC